MVGAAICRPIVVRPSRPHVFNDRGIVRAGRPHHKGVGYRYEQGRDPASGFAVANISRPNTSNRRLCYRASAFVAATGPR